MWRHPHVANVLPLAQVTYTDSGLEAILFTAEGDMRNALNSLQATHAGFGVVNDTNVYKVRRAVPVLPALV